LQYQVGTNAFVDVTNLSYSVSSSGGGAIAVPIYLTNFAALQNVGAGVPVTFRIVNFAANNSGGTWYIYDRANTTAADLAIDGTVASASVPPAGPPVFTAVGLTNNQLDFTVTGTLGANYILQFATNLTAPNWVPLRTNPAPFRFTATNANPAPAGFYRALLAP
jgi:hypothetical protein